MVCDKERLGKVWSGTMTQKIGDKELALRAQREARFTSAKVPRSAPVDDLREKVAGIPEKRGPKAKKAKL